MSGNELQIPPLIDSLVAKGAWPATSKDALRQNRAALVPAHRIKTIAPGEDGLYLFAPPFGSVASHTAEYPTSESGDYNFWITHGSLHEIDPDKALVIGDFGLGSDAPIVLDYRQTPEPSVIRLTWSPSDKSGSGVTSWVAVADSIQEFAQELGLI